MTGGNRLDGETSMVGIDWLPQPTSGEGFNNDYKAKNKVNNSPHCEGNSKTNVRKHFFIIIVKQWYSVILEIATL